MKGIYIRVDEELLRRLDEVARRLGYMRSEAVREALRRFILFSEPGGETSRIRGLVKSRLTLRELEETYMVVR